MLQKSNRKYIAARYSLKFRGIFTATAAVVSILHGTRGTHAEGLPAYAGRVVSVADGDTLWVLSGGRRHKVRLFGVDCPEREQRFGSAALQETVRIADEKDVMVIPRSRDEYGRTVARIVLPGGKSLEDHLVAGGWCWWYRHFDPHNTTLQRLEKEARTAHRGVWSDPDAVSPWQFRRLRPEGSERSPPSPESAAPPPSLIVGNSRSRVYHLPGCRERRSVSLKNRILFTSEEEAIQSGFRKSGSCTKE